MQAPVLVLNQNARRETGPRAQLTNIVAARSVSDIIRTTLGPRAMLKMILDPMGNIVLTNDGHAILREIDVAHPAAKAIIDLSRTQDDEVGDGTTSVTVIAGELLHLSQSLLKQNVHPTVIVSAFFKALHDAVDFVEQLALPVDPTDRSHVCNLIRSAVGTKFVTSQQELVVNIAHQALTTVRVHVDGKPVMDIKNFAKVEKIAGGHLEDSLVLDGVMFNKDVTSAKMRRRIENPRVLLLDCPLEYRKPETTTNVEITAETDWKRLLQVEEDHITSICQSVLALNPDVVITEKGTADLALHLLLRANVSVIRRIRKSDNNRISKATGATVVSRVDHLKDSDVGTGAALFEVSKIGDEYYTFLTGCKDPKACTILLRGGSRDVLDEVERNLQDAMAVGRNILIDPRMVPGGGAIEMAVAHRLKQKSKKITGVQQHAYRLVAEALEVIPRTLVENCGGNVVRVLTALRAKHNDAQDDNARFWGIDGLKGKAVDIRSTEVWEPVVVKTQTFKTAVEASAMLLRIDDIVSGLTSKKDKGPEVRGPADDD